ncbi:MAG: hypothetical protein IJW08_06565 [Lentisphaeria bacterium]|nr:hypothetical protein [Lentisphaeria bacterium]
MKPEKASLHAPKVRFMAHSAASYILMLDEQSSQAQNVLHKNAFSDEAASFHSAMKHFPFHSKYEALRLRSV